MALQRKKFSTQADPAILAEMHRIAESEGRQLQAVIEEAFQDFIEKHKTGKLRPHVMTHFQASLEKNRELGRLLAQ
jgi:hypothetical protein